MCKSMQEFETIMKEIQAKKAEKERVSKELESLEAEIKKYLSKRGKQELESKSTGVIVSYKTVQSRKFKKELFIEKYGNELYEECLVSSSSTRLNYLKPKKA